MKPGAVTPLAVMNDPAGEVTLVLDKALMEARRDFVKPVIKAVETELTGMSDADIVDLLDEAALGVPVESRARPTVQVTKVLVWLKENIFGTSVFRDI